MLKPIALLLTMTLFITGTMHGQTLSAPPKQNREDLKEAISKETRKLKSESAVLDVKKLEKIDRQTPQNSWNKNTVIITGVLVALVALAVVLAFTTKRCKKRSPSGCSFTEDTNCQCLEYAE